MELIDSLRVGAALNEGMDAMSTDVTQYVS